MKNCGIANEKEAVLKVLLLLFRPEILVVYRYLKTFLETEINSA
jgi:hypothetical protein